MLRCLAANFFAKGAVSNEACISRKALGCLVYVIIIKETPRDRTVSGRFGRGQTNEMNARILRSESSSFFLTKPARSAIMNSTQTMEPGVCSLWAFFVSGIAAGQ